MYSFGRVMYHLLTLVIPWYGIDEIKVFQKILSGADIPRPAISDATSDVTDARWNHIEQCWSIDPSARPCAFTAMNFVKGELEALKQDGGVQESHQSSLDVEQIIASVPPSRGVPSQIMTTRMFHSSSQTLIPSPSQATPPSPFTHLFSPVSALTLSGPLNVLLFGETGVGKSSVINLIMGGDAAQTSPDGATCTLTHTPHKINLGPHTFKLWEVSSIESMGFFKTFFKQWTLKKQYKRLYKDDGVYLLLYCMRGSRAQRALLRDYNFFTGIVGSTAGPGRVPVAAVVTSLEDYPENMDNWWTNNKDNLERLGMSFSAHACITSLPDNPKSSSIMRARRQRSEQAIRRLIYESYQTGTETPRSSSPALA
ncbi:hypothetical protein BDR03DRAFT_399675 [Suillus americanus]|nr:hypothetical protein BDR03DRAFT_399675 [Suillus americanus]